MGEISPLGVSSYRVRRMLRTIPNVCEGWPRSSALAESCIRGLRIWAAGTPVLAGKPTDREAYDWLEGFTPAAWVARVEFLLDPILVDLGTAIVWTPDPWPVHDSAVLFSAVVQSMVHATTSATCPHSADPTAFACPRCGHEQHLARWCQCFGCQARQFALSQRRKGET